MICPVRSGSLVKSSSRSVPSCFCASAPGLGVPPVTALSLYSSLVNPLFLQLPLTVRNSLYSSLGFTDDALVKSMPGQCRRPKRCRFDPWVRKIPWRREWQPTPVFLPGESHGQRSLAGYSPWGRKESEMTEQTHVLGFALKLTYSNCSVLSVSELDPD